MREYNNFNLHNKISIEDCFPFKKFRDDQEKILKKVKNSLEGEKEVIIIEGPTGFGKSPVNIALGKYFKPTFYTTPQVKLINQLAKDFCPKKLAIDGGTGPIIPLLGRKNYICRFSNVESDKCPIYEGKRFEEENRKIKCSEESKCVYWKQKEAALNSDIAILTFAMLITNTYLTGDSRFQKRNLLIIDECHSLESQVASMFAGFTISPNVFPKSMRITLWQETIKILPKTKNFDDYIPFFRIFRELCINWIPLCLNERERDQLINLLRKINYMHLEIDEGRTWVVNIVQNKDYSFKGKPRQFKPIYIDKFLQRKVWLQGSKIILSSATIPFRSDIERWLILLGLGDKDYSFYSIPMNYPIQNRPILTSCMGGKMTTHEEQNNWKENLNTIKEIIKKHKGERGVIHTHSYARAKRIVRDLKGYSIFLHKRGEIDGDIIEEWINSNKLVLVSPAITEGVDLKDDLCRFQILLKVPYPSIGDSRVKYLLNEKKQWTWYYNETAKNIIQMYGRAVRSPTDFAKFYIIDGSFKDICSKVKFPDWFLQAVK